MTPKGTQVDYPTDHHVAVGRRVAREVHSRWGWRWGGLERGELESEAWIWLDRHTSALKRWEKEGKVGDLKLRRALHRHLADVCRRHLRRDADEAGSESIPAYSEPEIIFVLGLIASGSQWDAEMDQVPLHLAASAQSDDGDVPFVTYDDSLAAIADVTAAYWSLTERNRELLVKRYVENAAITRNEQIGSRTAMRKLKAALAGEGASWSRSQYRFRGQ